jgi:hypothetical protein
MMNIQIHKIRSAVALSFFNKSSRARKQERIIPVRYNMVVDVLNTNKGCKTIGFTLTQTVALQKNTTFSPI